MASLHSTMHASKNHIFNKVLIHIFSLKVSVSYNFLSVV